MENRSQQGAESSLVDDRFSDLFIEGFFAARAKAGERPTYGYPANHLPDVKGELEIKTTFLS